MGEIWPTPSVTTLRWSGLLVSPPHAVVRMQNSTLPPLHNLFTRNRLLCPFGHKYFCIWARFSESVNDASKALSNLVDRYCWCCFFGGVINRCAHSPVGQTMPEWHGTKSLGLVWNCHNKGNLQLAWWIILDFVPWHNSCLFCTYFLGYLHRKMHNDLRSLCGLVWVHRYCCTYFFFRPQLPHFCGAVKCCLVLKEASNRVHDSFAAKAHWIPIQGGSSRGVIIDGLIAPWWTMNRPLCSVNLSKF